MKKVLISGFVLCVAFLCTANTSFAGDFFNDFIRSAVSLVNGTSNDNQQSALKDKQNVNGSETRTQEEVTYKEEETRTREEVRRFQGGDDEKDGYRNRRTTNEDNGGSDDEGGNEGGNENVNGDNNTTRGEDPEVVRRRSYSAVWFDR